MRSVELVLPRIDLGQVLLQRPEIDGGTRPLQEAAHAELEALRQTHGSNASAPPVYFRGPAVTSATITVMLSGPPACTASFTSCSAHSCGSG